MDERVNMLEALRVIVANRRAVLATVMGAALVSIALALVLPKWYRGVAVILPPESELNQTNMATMMRLAGVRPAMIPTASGQTEIYSAILRSETVVDAVIDSLDLMRVYRAGDLRGARESVYDRLKVAVTSEGLVRLEYEDRDEARAASVANALVGQLDRFSRETLMTSAGKVRRFVEGRLAETAAELTRAQDDLKAFKEQTGVVLITEQATASIKAAAEIYGAIAQLEVGLERAREYATEKSPEVLDLKSQIRALDRKLAEMGYMDQADAQPGSLKLFPSFKAAPELERRLGDLMMQVEIKRSVYAALAEQYEQAKISEARDTPTIQVLDWAKQPLLRSKPRRKVIVLIATASALILACFAVLVRERLMAGGNLREREALGAIGRMIASDWRSARSTLGRGGKRAGV